MSSDISTEDSSLNGALDGTRTDCLQQVIMHHTSPKEDVLEHSSSSSSISYSSQASFSDHQMSDYNPELDQFGAPAPALNLVGCHGDEMVVNNNFLDELIEIPFEPNLDLWDLLHGGSKSNSADSEAQSSELDQIPNYPLSESDSRVTNADGGSWWWMVYLENELGLGHDEPTSLQLQATNGTCNEG